MTMTQQVLANHYGLTRYDCDSYTHQPTYSTVERLGGKWTVLDISDTVVFTGTFEECCQYVTQED